MSEYEYLIVDVFTRVPLQGNPLAVFPDANRLGGDDMQRIAAEFNLSETAFILPSQTAEAAARVRVFTPRRELDFAGHPTIGSAYVLREKGISSLHFAIEENVGSVPIDVEIERDDPAIFWLTTPPLTFYETVDAALCARLLNLDSRDVAPEIPPQFVSAGAPLLFICLNSPAAVDRAELQHAYLKDAIGSVNSCGTFIFARKDPQSTTCFDVYSRMFAPQMGIAEDPATGGATGPLAGYLHKYGKIPRSGVHFISEQGVKMGRRSILHVQLREVEGEPSIKVGGSVVRIAQGVFLLR